MAIRDLLILLLGAFCSALALAEAPPLILVSDDFPPYAYEENGRATGLSFEVVEAVFQRLGVPVEVRIYPWRRALLMAEKGAVDGVVNASHLASREASLAYTQGQRDYDRTGVPVDHLWYSNYVFFVNRSNVSEWAGLDYREIAEAGCRVGINRDFAYDDRFRQATFKRVVHTTPSESMAALAARKIDLFACDRSVGLWILNKLGLHDTITFISEPLFSKPYLAVFSKNSRNPQLPEIAARFYAELESFRDTETFFEICRRYRACDNRWLPRPLIFVCEDWKPFEYEKDGAVHGLNAEVVERIMGRIGVPFEIRIYPWRRAWRMVEQGAADAVLSVSYHPEREKFLYFTETQRQAAASGGTPPDYLWKSEYYFFVKRSRMSRFAFDSYEDIIDRGYRIGINRNYTYSRDFPFARFTRTEFNSTRDGFMALVAEEIDLYPMDRLVGLTELKDLGLLESVAYIPKPLFAKPYLAPFSKTSDFPNLKRLMAAFNRELMLMRQSGEYDEIFLRHCGEALPPREIEDRP